VSGAVARIGKAGDGVESALNTVGPPRRGYCRHAAPRRRALRLSTSRLRARWLGRRRGELLDMAGDAEIPTDDIAPASAPLMARMRRQYTMTRSAESTAP